MEIRYICKAYHTDTDSKEPLFLIENCIQDVKARYLSNGPYTQAFMLQAYLSIPITLLVGQNLEG